MRRSDGARAAAGASERVPRRASAQVHGRDVRAEVASARKGRRAQLALVRLEPEVHRRDVLPQVVRSCESGVAARLWARVRLETEVHRRDVLPQGARLSE